MLRRTMLLTTSVNDIQPSSSSKAISEKNNANPPEQNNPQLNARSSRRRPTPAAESYRLSMRDCENLGVLKKAESSW